MADYVPTLVTSANYSAAVASNIKEAIRVLATKVHISQPNSVGSIDADSNRISIVGQSENNHSACTYQQFHELWDENLSTPAFLLLEDNSSFLLLEDNSSRLRIN